jgi:pentatricopeptide repeat protein
VHSLHCFGLQLYDEMQEHGIKPNQSIFTVMATVFAKCGNLDRGIKMVRAIEKSGERAGTETKSAILSGLALAGRLDEAFALYDEIKKEGVLPHAYAVGTLVVGTFLCSDKYTSKLSQDSFMQLSLCNLIQHQAEHLIGVLCLITLNFIESLESSPLCMHHHCISHCLSLSFQTNFLNNL